MDIDINMTYSMTQDKNILFDDFNTAVAQNHNIGTPLWKMSKVYISHKQKIILKWELHNFILCFEVDTNQNL